MFFNIMRVCVCAKLEASKRVDYARGYDGSLELYSVSIYIKLYYAGNTHADL